MKNKAGILWMVATTVLFVIVTAVVRYLGSEMHPVQAAFLRYAFGVALIIPFCLRTSLFRIPFARLRLHAFRGVAHGIAIMLWFFAMMRLPIAEVTALSFMTPVFIIIGASVFLKEHFYRHRAIAVALGIAGGLIILQPGFRVIDLGAIAQLVAAPLFAVSMLIAKNLTRSESNGHILLMLSVFCTLTLTLPAIAIWRQPTLEELSWLFLCAVFATAGHYCMTRAFRSAEIAALQPITFLQLVWATLMGSFLFGEQPNFWVWLGGGIIVISATYNARKEQTVRSHLA
ncbi:MAG TPA: DMT family transporter [Gammaproteobacteria bacterium]|nr:DMT family transporter [Gammaproteobacteria bacterium]HIL17798.1 DMT family transporter [Gammaproteobacteria bacterium]